MFPSKDINTFLGIEKLRVLITGADGFIGQHLFNYLSALGAFEVNGTSREQAKEKNNGFFITGDILHCDWSNILKGHDVVIHTAGVLGNESGVSSKKIFEVNVLATARLFKSAISAGVKHFIFISTIGVNGADGTKPFSETDSPSPKNYYAKSKLLAEEKIKSLSLRKQISYTIIRPPAVYGSTKKGPFKLIEKFLCFYIPIPFGSLSNKRTYMSVCNLSDFVKVCLIHEGAKNEIFCVGDADPISLNALIRKMAEIKEKSPILIPVPPRVINYFFDFLRMQSLKDRITGTLLIDLKKAKTKLDWEPIQTLDQGLKKYLNFSVKKR